MTTKQDKSNPIKSTSVLKPSFITRLYTIDKNTIKNFAIDSKSRRMIRMGKVKDLLRALDKLSHFNSPFVVNEINDEKYDLIDGNHRFEAIKLKIAKNPEFKISVWMMVYRNLTRLEAKEIFRVWNIGQSQTATDFLQLYFETLPYGKQMLQILPVTLYGETTKLGIKLVVGSYISVKKQTLFKGGYGAGREEIIADFAMIAPEDIEIIKEFCDFMQETFGEYHKDNNSLFYKTTPIPVFFRIWYDNKENIDRKSMVTIFKKVFASQIGAWKSICEIGGRNSQILFYRQAIEALNSLQTRKHFLSDKEIVPEKEKAKEIVAIVKQK